MEDSWPESRFEGAAIYDWVVQDLQHSLVAQLADATVSKT
jgi:hypothetical protein